MSLPIAPSSAASTLIPWIPDAPGLADWVFEQVLLEEDDTLCVKLKRRGARDFVDIRVCRIRDRSTYFKRLRHVQVAYRGSVADRSEATRAALAQLIDGIAGAVDALVEARPDATLPEVLGRLGGARDCTFGRDGLLDLLAPHFHPGDEVVGGWRFADAYPSQQIPGLQCDEPTMVLDFRHAEAGRQALFTVAARHEGSVAHVLTAHFCLTVLAGFGNPAGSETLQALVAFALQLQDHDGLAWEFPARLEYVVEPMRPLLNAADLDAPAALLTDGAPVEETAVEGEILNLAVLSECGQACRFCSVKLTMPARDGGEETLQELCRNLLDSRRRGVRRVRVNGYDPLSFSRILDVLRFATGLGYDEAQLFSPCTLLADAAFATEVVRAAPPESVFYPPLYAMDAGVHDRVVGRPGAHALVLAAIENLVALVGPARIHLLSVVTQDNLDDVPAVFDFAEARGFRFNAHLPYPSQESRGDRFYECAPRQIDVARALAPKVAEAEIPSKRTDKLMEGVAPCVIFRAMARLGVPPKRWLEVADARTLLPGTDYRDARYRQNEGGTAFVSAAVPCPEASRCTLASVCPTEILRAYADLYGLDEFRAVTLRDLLGAS